MSSFINRLKQQVTQQPVRPSGTSSAPNVMTNINKKAEISNETHSFPLPSWDDKYFISSAELLEDSPLARDKLRQLELQCEKTTMKLKKVIALSKQYQQIGNQFKDISAQFGYELMNWEYSDLPNNELSNQSIQLNIKQLGQSILELNDYQGMLLLQMGNVFTQPIEQFLQEQLKSLKDSRLAHYTTRNKYDNSLSKNSQIKKGEVNIKTNEIENELINDRVHYQVSSFEYLFKLKEIQFSTKVEYIERACSFLYAEKAYFTQGIFFYFLFVFLFVFIWFFYFKFGFFFKFFYLLIYF